MTNVLGVIIGFLGSLYDEQTDIANHRHKIWSRIFHCEAMKLRIIEDLTALTLLASLVIRNSLASKTASDHTEDEETLIRRQVMTLLNLKLLNS